MSKIDNIKIGDIYGIQKVLEVNVYNPNSKSKKPIKSCKCKCILCGKISYKPSYGLINGQTNSCRCRTDEATRQRNKNNSSVKVGNIYGYLEVIEDLGYRKQSRGKNESWYRCKCHHCGNENFEVNGNNLQSKGTTSCGCINSHGEDYIGQILRKNNVNFCKQYSFPDLLSPKNSRMYFDFAILNDDNQILFLIEFDGRQHYTGLEASWNKSRSLEEIQFYDKLKNDYCKNNNIILKRIPYYDIDKISLKTLLDDTFII